MRKIALVVDTQIKLQSRPGVPMCAAQPTNAEVLNKDRQFLIDCVYERLTLLAFFQPPEDAREIVEEGFADPVKLFVKNEPHSQKKKKSNRWRLISSVSLIDQVVERILCGPQNRVEIDRHLEIPSQPGMGATDEDLKNTYEKVRKMSEEPDFGDLAEADVTGFDWSVQPWEHAFEAQIRADLYDLPEEHVMRRMLAARAHCLVHACFVNTNGEILELEFPGIQLSGSYNTSSSNSRLRYVMAMLVGSSDAITMGDDCVEKWVENAMEKYRSFGHPLKMYIRCKKGFEFCSQRYADGSAEPLNFGKTFYRFLHQDKRDDELVHQLLYEMRHHPKLPLIKEYVAEC